MDLKSLIRTIPDYPKPGILFRDISTLLYNGNALKYITEIYYNRYKDKNLTGIAAIEARGFIFGSIVAEKLGIAFIPIRKKGKLPCKVYTEEYQLEYGTDSLEVDVTAINSSDNILIIDDLIATGGTAKAAAELIELSKGNVAAFIFVINLFDLGGSDNLINRKYKVENLIEFPGH